MVEVLSEGTAQFDLIQKRIACEAILALCRIVYVSVDQARVDMRVRGEDGHWREETVLGLDAAMPLPELDLLLPLAEIYEDSGVASGA